MARTFGGRGFGFRPRFTAGGWGGWPGTSVPPEAVDPQFISRIQSCLYQSIGSWVPQTGSLGPETRRAIAMFQSRHGLPANGILDGTTIAELERGCRSGIAPDAGVAGEVSGTSSPTDYTSQQVIDARYQEAVHRGDRILNDVRPITVKYDSNFDQFAAAVAYALRDQLYYRHDGGKNARGLVRATGDLKTIHSLYASFQHPANGTPIQLNAILQRRQDPQPDKRWVMAIRFNDSHGWGFVDVKEPENIVVNPDDLKRKAMDSVLKAARLDCPNLPGNRGKRICEMVSIAERLKYPKNWDLWYYERSIVDEYIDSMRTGPARRAEMTKSTGGKVPFDGPATIWGAEWRIYPFRDAAIRCSQGGDCKAITHNILVHSEDEINRTYADMTSLFHKVDSAAWFGPLVETFRQHLVSLQNNPDTLYYPFVKYPN
jgi:peptidoglycan hydrolase-like protein with peptidoglycan-binding domain